MYQYLLNTDDRKVVEYLKVFTFLNKEEIDALELSVKNEPEKRLAQKTLAYEIVKDLHGKEEADMAVKTSEEVFSKGYSEEGMESVDIEYTDNMNLMDLLVKTNIAPSKSEARRLIVGNGISINSNKETNPEKIITKDLFDNNLVVSKGKKTHIKVNLIK
jgi:tyrosyl-tRNA synthetase